MEMKEIAEKWLSLPFLEKFQKDGEQISNDINVLKRFEKIKTELRDQRGKK